MEEYHKIQTPIIINGKIADISAMLVSAERHSLNVTKNVG